jgi:hypothetical protein
MRFYNKGLDMLISIKEIINYKSFVNNNHHNKGFKNQRHICSIDLKFVGMICERLEIISLLTSPNRFGWRIIRLPHWFWV